MLGNALDEGLARTLTAHNFVGRGVSVARRVNGKLQLIHSQIIVGLALEKLQKGGSRSKFWILSLLKVHIGEVQSPI